MARSDCEVFCDAEIAGDLDTVSRMLKQEESMVDCRGKVREDHRAYRAGEGAADGWTPLHLASHYGQPQVINRAIAVDDQPYTLFRKV
jgi:ankyrin repeat protein